MIILGIDPGIADTGYGIIKKNGSEWAAVAYGSIATKAHAPLGERLHELWQELVRLIALHQPDMVAVEELFFAKNTKTALAVAHGRGIALLAAQNHGCAVREFTPLQVKQALTGYGRADKNQIQQMVKTMLRLSAIPRPDDAADALAVAICASQTKEF